MHSRSVILTFTKKQVIREVFVDFKCLINKLFLGRHCLSRCVQKQKKPVLASYNYSRNCWSSLLLRDATQSAVILLITTMKNT